MLTEAQAREALTHLLLQLRDRGLFEAAAEVDAAAAARLAEEVPEGDLDLFDEEDRKNVFVTRAPRPNEAFFETLAVLRVRLLEVPAIAARLSKSLGYPPEQIVFRPDAGQGDVSGEDTYFSAADFSLSELERASIERMLDNIAAIVASI